MVERSERRELLVSKGWVQAVGLVMLFGFFILGLLAYRTYTQQAAGAAHRGRCPRAGALHRRGHLARASRSSCTTG